MLQLPIFLYIFFVLTTLITVYVFWKATRYSNTVLYVICIWLAIQGILALKGFYLVTDAIPPRILLFIGPPLLLIIALFLTSRGRAFIDSLDVKILTLLFTIRIPVELILFWLYLNKAVPLIMTFEGRNIDILVGITAPMIFYLVYIRKSVGRIGLLVWNIFGLASLINIVSIAVLSVPVPFQKFAFEQPNIAVLHFPFNWLPACIVPIVLFSHLVILRQKVKGKR